MPEEIDAQLAKTLEDHRLSRNERQALGDLLGRLERAEERLAVCRQAFELAGSRFDAADGRAVLDWLEDVVKLLLRPADPHAPLELCEALFSPGDGCPRRIVQLLGHARRKVDICVFTITDDRITSAILEARQRDVAIRVITDNDKVADEGSDIDRLRDAGIPVRVDRTEYHMHHKFAIFDDATLLTGSYNWTRGAAQYNNENFIVVGDRRLLTAFGRTFERLWDSLA